MSTTPLPAIDPSRLPPGLRSRFVNNGNGLELHLLEAGFEVPGRPCVLLLHGFPEMAYSWRAVMPAIANAGYHVIAPDQRGYGRTRGWQHGYDVDLGCYRFTNLVTDLLGLLDAVGHSSVAMVAGHDFGSPVAACAAMMRPDVFQALAMMSAPFPGPPARPLGASGDDAVAPMAKMRAELAALSPPRMHYQDYYCTRQADADMWHCPQGVHDFLRAYFHMKSADWSANRPRPLAAWSAGELARLPRYYVMDRDQDMARTVAGEMPDAEAIAGCRWLTEADLEVYSEAYAATGFQGGLNWYRARLDANASRDMLLFSGSRIHVPACFIAGRSDWGIYQKPGDLERMRDRVCTRMLGCHLLDGAGHWVQQEQPQTVNRVLLDFLNEASRAC